MLERPIVFVILKGVMIFLQLFLTFLKIGVFTIGSGYSMLVLAERYLVQHYQWITMEEFADIVAIAEVTPGPIIVNLATFVGTRIAGVRGALCATSGLIVVPLLCIMLIAFHYERFKDMPVVQNIFRVLRPVAVGFIAVAIIKLSRQSITDLRSAFIAVAAIVATYVFHVNPIYTILASVALALTVFRHIP